MDNNKSGARRSSIIEGIVIAIFILIIAFTLYLYFSFSNEGAAPNIFGYNIYHTQAVNMQPDIPAGAAIIAKASEKDKLKTGSVALCSFEEGVVAARVADVIDEDSGRSYIVYYDTKPADTYKIPDSKVIARALYTSTLLGTILSFATSNTGVLIVIIIPSVIIILMQAVRILNDKHEREAAMELDDLNQVMLENSYPEEAFLPQNSYTPVDITDPPQAQGQISTLAFTEGAAEDTAAQDLFYGAPQEENKAEETAQEYKDIFGEDAPVPAGTASYSGDFFPDTDEAAVVAETAQPGIIPEAASETVAPAAVSDDIFGDTYTQEKKPARKKGISEEASLFYSITDDIFGSSDTEEAAAEEDAQAADTADSSTLSDALKDELYTGFAAEDNAQEDKKVSLDKDMDVFGTASPESPEITLTENILSGIEKNFENMPAGSETTVSVDPLAGIIEEQDSKESSIISGTADSEKVESIADVFEHNRPMEGELSHQEPAAAPAAEEPVRKTVKKVVRKKRKAATADELLGLLDSQSEKLR